MKFSKLSEFLERLETNSSRIEITKILAELFNKSQVEETDKIVYLVLGRLAPSYKGIVFNLADKLVLQAIAIAGKSEIDTAKKLYKKTGDLGLVAQELSKGKDSGWGISKIYEKLYSIAKEEGEGSVERRIQTLVDILNNVDSSSAKYIVRIPLGRLRLGFSDLTVLDALSWMETGDKSRKKQLEKAYQVLPDIGLLAKEAKDKGIERATKLIKPILGIPVMPMLCQRIKSPTEMIEKMDEVAVEPKYDGVRVCIHFKRGSPPRAFTRNLNDISDMFPELDKLGDYVKADGLILDAEGMGIDPKKKSLLDFQSTMHRRRKHGIEEISSKIPLNFYIFDILYKDGETLMDKSYPVRRAKLAKTIKETGPFKLTPFEITKNPSVITNLHKKYLAQGLEGVIVKKVTSEYIPGRTGNRWVKMKESEDSTGKLSDTVDSVIMGYTGGQGKRVNFGLGQFLAGVREGESFKSVTKVGTGLTDEQFRELKTRLEPLIVKEKPSEYEVNKDLAPDFWVKPEVVVELAADDLTVSPKHTAGYALRFPRLVKFRDDKSPNQATTVKEVEKLYKLQKK
jgi:DNA ligase-1